MVVTVENNVEFIPFFEIINEITFKLKKRLQLLCTLILCEKFNILLTIISFSSSNIIDFTNIFVCLLLRLFV